MPVIKDALLGLAIGDALGVPHEFKPREKFDANPVTDMDGYGTYNLPPGTWSDDASLSLCLAEALTNGFDLESIATNFQNWFHSNYWTARGEVFDIGITTREAIDRLSRGIKPDLAGGFDENENGNGSLMRILPLLFYIKDLPISERFHLIKLVSSITHGHDRSIIACFYYLEFGRLLLEKHDKLLVYSKLKTDIPAFLRSINITPSEIKQFDRLLIEDIGDRSQSEISSTGYVLHSLEASIWCLLTTGSYRDAVLKAVNLGNDTDTNAAITGGLAGILYGAENIPANWLNMLARRADIEELAMKLAQRLTGMYNDDIA
jgi:ADP-ribosyl-[dinitrogen reductase] hydrolase